MLDHAYTYEMHAYDDMQMIRLLTYMSIVKGGVNFGVWQMPLFNILGPECTDNNSFWTIKVEGD